MIMALNQILLLTYLKVGGPTVPSVVAPMIAAMSTFTRYYHLLSKI